MRSTIPNGAKVPELSPEKLKELKKTASGILAECRRSLLNTQPFIGTVAMTLDIVPTRDESLPTAATDGQHIYFDIDFLASLGASERVFVLAHEIWHNVMLHPLRTENRDPELFNIALDLEVNSILQKDGMTVPADAEIPSKRGLPPELSAEQYYDLLYQKQQKQQQRGGFGGGGGGGGSNQQNQSQNQTGGNKNGQLKGQFDQHIKKTNVPPTQQPAQGNQQDKYGKVGKDPDFRPQVNDSSVEKVRESAISAAQNIERSRGTIPDHIKRIIDGLLEPEIPWKDVLSQFVTRVMGDGRSWTPPNRRHIYRHLYLQSRRSEKVRITVGIDVSGSTQEYISKFLSEVNGIIKSFNHYEINILQCNTEITKEDKFTDDNPLDPEHYEVVCGGGTYLHPIFDRIANADDDNEEDVHADCLCVLTDGYTEQFPEGDAPDYPVLWVITPDGCSERNVFGFGEVLQMQDERRK